MKTRVIELGRTPERYAAATRPAPGYANIWIRVAAFIRAEVAQEASPRCETEVWKLECWNEDIYSTILVLMLIFTRTSRLQ